MSPSDAPNPERKSNNAILCFCIGAGFAALAYVFGFGAVLATAFSGGDPAAIVGGLAAMVILVLAAICGGVMMLVGGVWMIVRVIADQTGDKEEQRYRDVER
ncbi:MAG: hypothetical protein WDM79_13825 [Terricaulis sp.]